MEKTYTSQGLLINKNTQDNPVGEVKDKWPFLFQKDCMLLHFELLMGFKIQEVLNQSLERKPKSHWNI